MTSSLKLFHLRHLAVVQDFQDTDLPSLREALATIPDPRARRGVRYGFTELLVVAVAAMLTGASTLTTIAEWAADAHHRNVLVGWKTTPSIATIHRIIAALDAAVLDTVLTTWTKQRYQHALAQSSTAKPPQLQAIAIDGKEVCGAKHGDGTKTVLMAALDHCYGMVLGQESVAAKSNEIPFLPGLLDQLGDLNGTVITADALHTLAQQATAITSRGGHYLCTVKTNAKTNAKTLHQAINDVGWSARRPQYQHTEKGHGRISSWQLTVAPAHARVNFPHAAQVMRMHRGTKQLGTPDQATGEVVYLITSLPASMANPEHLAALIRGHWCIENRLHWVRDTAFNEDASQIRTGTAPRTMAVLRNLVISIHRLAGHTNLTATLRAYARNPELALELTGL